MRQKESFYDKVRNIRLINQQLLINKCQTPNELVAWMGAIQAQDYNMAKWAIGIRLPDSDNDLVEKAFNQGEILRTHVLRPTWHFVTPENIRWMLALSAERIKSSSRSRDRDLGITEELYNQSNRIIRKALEKQPYLTKEALEKEFEKEKIVVDYSCMIHFMMRAEQEGIVCSGPLEAKKQTYALLDKRVPPYPVLPKEEAHAKLVQIYFDSHSPATLHDFCWWSGLSLTEAKKGMEAVKTGFYAEEIEGQTYWISCSSNDGYPSKNSAVFLLPAFDEYIISYRDRRAAITLDNHSKAVSSNGVFRPIIVVDGKVVGVWKKTSNSKNPIQWEYFEQPDDKIQSRITKEAKNYLGFVSKN